MALLSPQLDVVFKLLFGRNQDLLLEMLRAVLDADTESLTVLNPEMCGETIGEKMVILDLHVLLKSGTRVAVEMQVRAMPELVPRLSYYTAREYSHQLQAGQGYDALMPTVTVIWQVQPLMPKLNQYHSVFELRERGTGYVFSEDFRIHLLELSKLKNRGQEPSSAKEVAVRQWSEFLKVQTEAELETLKTGSEIMAKAAQALDRLSQDPEAQRLAEDRRIAEILHNAAIAGESRRARKAGLTEGREEGERSALRRLIEHFCERFGIELTADRRAQLQAPSSESELQALLDAVVIERRWLEL